MIPRHTAAYIAALRGQTQLILTVAGDRRSDAHLDEPANTAGRFFANTRDSAHRLGGVSITSDAEPGLIVT